MNTLEIRNITKTFGPEVAVDDCSFSVKEGQLKSLLGPSGCGKTTTLRCIAGLEQPDSGEIYVDDELVTAPAKNLQVPPRRRGIGMVFQNYAVWPHMTVRQNVRFPLDHMQIGSSAYRAERVETILDMVGLLEHADDLAPNLSGGQQQRVALARALVHEPEILLLDEPLSNLDAKLRKGMRHEIRRICDELNVTMLYVTHSQDEALFLSDEIAIMNHGRIVEEGPPKTIHANPRSFFGMTFLGECNTLEGSVETMNGASASISTPIGTFESTNLIDTFEPGSEVFVCFRPKFCSVSGDGQADRSEYGAVIDGEVTFEGTTTDYYEYYITSDGTVVHVRSPVPVAAEIGDRVSVKIKREDIIVFSRDRETYGERAASSGQISGINI